MNFAVNVSSMPLFSKRKKAVRRCAFRIAITNKYVMLVLSQQEFDTNVVRVLGGAAAFGMDYVAFTGARKLAMVSLYR